MSYNSKEYEGTQCTSNTPPISTSHRGYQRTSSVPLDHRESESPSVALGHTQTWTTTTTNDEEKGFVRQEPAQPDGPANRAELPPLNRRIKWKLDSRIIGVMGFVVMIEFLDRVGLGFARLSGIDVELGLHHGFRFSGVVLVGSITGCVAAISMMFLGHRVYPPYFVGACVLTWAATLFGIAFSSRWTDLIGCRIVSGAAGAAAAQVTSLIVQTWYPRYEVGRRFAWLSILSWVSKAIGGIAAWGITRMAGTGGLAGWRWIYIWAGITTVVAGIVSLLLTVGYADDEVGWRGLVGHFLTTEEQQQVIERVERDRGDSEREGISVRGLLACAKDLKLYAFGLMGTADTSILVSLSVFSPMIMHHDFGFDVEKSEALYAPPYCFTAIFVFMTSQLSDRKHLRGPLLACCTIMTIIGLVLIGFATDTSARYAGLFFANGGSGASQPLLAAYQSNNIRGFQKRSFSTALLIAFNCIGGVIGSSVFRSEDMPRYLPGLITSIALAVMILVMIVMLSLHFRIENGKQRTRGKLLEGLVGFEYTY